MLARVLTAVVGIPAAVVLIFYPGGLPFAVAVGVVAAVGALEFYSGVRRSGARPMAWAGLLASIGFVVAARMSDRPGTGLVLSGGLALLLALCFLTEMVRRGRSPVVNVGATVLGAVYVGWLLSHLVRLRAVAGEFAVGSVSAEAGAWLVMLAFACTWACDTSAFFIGRSYGKTKLAPSLSPRKTIEGSTAGFVGSMLMAMVFGAAVLDIPAGHALALGAIFGVLCQFGDLAESAIKREMGVKDLGAVMPGHGGVLDRFDSILFAGPAAYYYAVFVMRAWPG